MTHAAIHHPATQIDPACLTAFGEARVIEIEQSIRAKVDAGIARDLATVKGCYGLLVDWEPYTAVAAAICDLAKAHPNIPEVKALVLALTTPRREHELEDVEQIAAEVAEEALA